MPSYYDFRTVLNVDPDTERACVGIAKRYGRRCENPISAPDRNTASRLLNQMDLTKDFSSSLNDLEQLASLMLCKGMHNSVSRPHLSQIEEMRQLWTGLVKNEYELIQKDRKRRALAKAKRDLVKMREAASSIKEELENETVQLRERKPLAEKQSNTFRPTLTREIRAEDPFVTRVSKEKERLPSLFDPPVARNKQSGQPYFQHRSDMPKNGKNTAQMLPTPEATPTKPTKSITVSTIEITNVIPAETTTERIEKTDSVFKLRYKVPVTAVVNSQTHESNSHQRPTTSKDTRYTIHIPQTPDPTPRKATESIIPAMNSQTYQSNFYRRPSDWKDTRDPIDILHTPNATPSKRPSISKSAKDPTQILQTLSDTLATEPVTPAINSRTIPSHFHQRTSTSKSVKDSAHILRTLNDTPATESVTPAFSSQPTQLHFHQRASTSPATKAVTPAINSQPIQSHLHQQASTSPVPESVTPAVNSQPIQLHLHERGSTSLATKAVIPAMNSQPMQLHFRQGASNLNSFRDRTHITQTLDTPRSEVTESLAIPITQTSKKAPATFGNGTLEFPFEFDFKPLRNDIPMVQKSLSNIPGTTTKKLERSDDIIPVFSFGTTLATDISSAQAEASVFSASSKSLARSEVDSRETTPITPKSKVICESFTTSLRTMASIADAKQTQSMSTTDNIDEQKTNTSAMMSTAFTEENMGSGETVIHSPIEVVKELESSEQAALASSLEHDKLPMSTTNTQAVEEDKENMASHQVHQQSSLQEPSSQQASNSSSNIHIPGEFPTTSLPTETDANVDEHVTSTKEEPLHVDESPKLQFAPSIWIEEGQDQFEHLNQEGEHISSAQISSISPGNQIIPLDLSASTAMPLRRDSSSLSRIYNTETETQGYGYAVITPPKRYSSYLTSLAQYDVNPPPPTPEEQNPQYPHQPSTSSPEMVLSPPSNLGSSPDKASTKNSDSASSESEKRCIHCGLAAPRVTLDAGTQTDVEIEPFPVYEEPEFNYSNDAGFLSSLRMRRLRERIVRRFRRGAGN